MQREIKFRAWVKLERQMLYRGIFDRNWYATPKNDEGGCHCVRGIHPDDRNELILMQYTGLKDRSGKEIYEGDIIRYNYHHDDNDTDFIGEVIYDIRKFDKGELDSFHVGFILKGIDIDKSYWYTDMPNLKDTEVIGNIYENPELLKEDK
jgi:uncharacterized phage protein (TIGR01671 family)